MKWLTDIREGLQNVRRASELAQDVQTCQERIGDLATIVAAFQEALGDQDRRQDQMQTEWASTLDKIGRWASRQSARERRDTDKKLDTLAAGPGEENGAPDVRTLTKPELRARAARLRMGANVTGNEGS